MRTGLLSLERGIMVDTVAPPCLPCACQPPVALWGRAQLSLLSPPSKDNTASSSGEGDGEELQGGSKARSAHIHRTSGLSPAPTLAAPELRMALIWGHRPLNVLLFLSRCPLSPHLLLQKVFKYISVYLYRSLKMFLVCHSEDWT